MLQDTEAYRHWQTARLAAARPGDQKQAAGEAFLRAQVERGLVFDREGLDPAMHLDGYALWGQAAPLYQFWPRLVELTADNADLSQRLAELGDRVLMAQMPLDGFAAGVTGFSDDSHLIQFDTGLFATVVLATQLLAKVSLPGPSLPGPDHCVEAAGLLEVLLAEYRLLNRYVAPKVLLQSPHHSEVAGEVAHAAEVFALTHEAAHILLGHVGTERDYAQRPYDEVTADVLALHILSGAYAGGAVARTRAATGPAAGHPPIDLLHRTLRGCRLCALWPHSPCSRRPVGCDQLCCAAVVQPAHPGRRDRALAPP
ncbi:hypothetical protein [Streptomyces sp. BK205]|uniref:hypothetical protein n=1 Tax=Streptomyces sp. BK205 TaxID=2512164 RepID=UPI0010483B96|nr:hypothetical protein [Streptomyces sp. BK205]